MRKKIRYVNLSEEPIFNLNTEINESISLSKEDFLISKIFSWYNQNGKDEKGYAWFLSYVKETFGEESEQKILSVKYIPNTYFWLARQAKLTTLPKKFIDRLDSFIKSKLDEIVAEVHEYKARESIQDRISDQIKTYSSDIEFEFDQWIQNGFKTEFNLEEYLRDKNVKHIHVPKLVERVEYIKKEFNEALAGHDEELVEAYAVFGKSKLKKIVQYLDAQVDVLNARKDISKTLTKITRKPRKIKKNPHKSVSKLKYKREDETFKIKSVDPVKIVDAEQLWVFNTKTRVLGVYRTDNVHGLFVKGSTIKNFDSKSSVGKTIRKPDVILPKVLVDGKVALKHTLDDIKAAEKKLNGRINKDCVLLRVV